MISQQPLSMKLVILATFAALACLLGSCNTTIGLGRDMRILGESMESSAHQKQGGDTSGAPIY